MPPEVHNALLAKKFQLCARNGCTNETRTSNAVTGMRMIRRAKLCKIIHAVEMTYCSKNCMTLDIETQKKASTNQQMQTVDFSK